MDVKPENYNAVLDVSLRGMLYRCQAFIPTLLVEEEARSPAPPRYPHKPESDFSAAGTTRRPRPGMLGLAGHSLDLFEDPAEPRLA